MKLGKSWTSPTFFVHFVIILSKTNSKHNLLHLSINSYPTESGVHGPPFIQRAIHSTARFCQRCLPRVWRNRKIHHIQTCKKMHRCQNVAWKRSIWSFWPDKTIGKPIQNMFEIWSILSIQAVPSFKMMGWAFMTRPFKETCCALGCMHWLYLSSTIFKFGKRHMYRTIWAVVVWSLAHTSGLISRTI